MDCVVCGGVTDTTGPEIVDLRFGVPGTYQVARCRSCGVEQTAPRLDTAELIATYERYYNFRSGDEANYARRRSAAVRSGLYRWWLRLDGDISFVLEAGRGRRLLDVGSNEGRNLALFAQSGFRAEGVEPNPAAWEASRRAGLVVHQGGLGDLSPEDPFDVVVMSNVLEHVHDPADVLAQARARLRPGGEIWISCPNASGWPRRRFGSSWINWHPPFHLVHFTEPALVALLERQGFEVIQRETVTPALWVAQSLIARWSARPGQATLAMRRATLLVPLLVLIRVLFGPALWIADRRGRGDCLVVRARRPAG